MIYVRLGGKNIEIFKVLFKICFFIINLPTYFLLNLNERQKKFISKKNIYFSYCIYPFYSHVFAIIDLFS